MTEESKHYKEIMDRITMVFDRLKSNHENTDYVHTLIAKYIQFKGDNKDFLKWVEKDRNEQEKKVREDENKLKQGKGKKITKLRKG